ncbi:MAG: hypothetical protein OEY34_08785, partial [Cyclobacteriaceae bacterium]|nr:hypothetical protein [Cyclobacteriaceae bacterium]
MSELKEKFGDKHAYFVFENDNIPPNTTSCDVVFDFDYKNVSNRLMFYHTLKKIPVFINIPKTSLAALFYNEKNIDFPVFG